MKVSSTRIRETLQMMVYLRWKYYTHNEYNLRTVTYNHKSYNFTSKGVEQAWHLTGDSYELNRKYIVSRRRAGEARAEV